MKTLVTVLLVFLYAVNVWGQLTPTVTPVVDQFGIIKSMNAKPPLAKGSVYLNDEWLSSNIYFKPGVFNGQKVENIPIKLDLKTNTIEVKTEEGIKVLPFDKVEKFEWLDPATLTLDVYTNCNKFTLDGANFDSFCTVYGDYVKLVKQNYVQVLKSNYNVAMDVGAKEDQIVRKSKLYLLKDNKMVECSKKTVYATMSDKASEIKKYIKGNNINLSNEDDLRALIDYYNGLRV
jgi:hypothetical protein